MKFYLTSRAEEEINKLEKKKSTKNIKQDIGSFFRELATIEKMRSVDETLAFKGKNTTRKKSRMKNSIIMKKMEVIASTLLYQSKTKSLLFAPYIARSLSQITQKTKLKRYSI
jgi:hypothetical protein